MGTNKWFNAMQPQTLQSAMFLLYFNAAFGILYFLMSGGNPFYLVQIAGAGAAFGIANEKKWGWYLGIGVSGIALLIGLTLLGSFSGLITLLFDILLVVLLLHPMSRSYQKTWFK